VSRKQRMARRRPVSGIVIGLAGVVMLAAVVLAVIFTSNSIHIGGSGSDQAGVQSGGQASSQSSQLQAARDFASCMRSHGDPGFPDPNAQGNFGAITPGSPADPNSDAYKSALPTCRSLMPQLGQQAQPQNQSKNVQFANCMRDHGVKNFPDPNSQGAFLMGGNVDPNSPTFKSAYQACQSLLQGRS
jgi:hypothetical protein